MNIVILACAFLCAVTLVSPANAQEYADRVVLSCSSQNLPDVLTLTIDKSLRIIKIGSSMKFSEYAESHHGSIDWSVHTQSLGSAYTTDYRLYYATGVLRVDLKWEYPYKSRGQTNFQCVRAVSGLGILETPSRELPQVSKVEKAEWQELARLAFEKARIDRDRKIIEEERRLSEKSQSSNNRFLNVGIKGVFNCLEWNETEMSVRRNWLDKYINYLGALTRNEMDSQSQLDAMFNRLDKFCNWYPNSNVHDTLSNFYKSNGNEELAQRVIVSVTAK